MCLSQRKTGYLILSNDSFSQVLLNRDVRQHTHTYCTHLVYICSGSCIEHSVLFSEIKECQGLVSTWKLTLIKALSLICRPPPRPFFYCTLYTLFPLHVIFHLSLPTSLRVFATLIHKVHKLDAPRNTFISPSSPYFSAENQINALIKETWIVTSLKRAEDRWGQLWAHIRLLHYNTLT